MPLDQIAAFRLQLIGEELQHGNPHPCVASYLPVLPREMLSRLSRVIHRSTPQFPLRSY